MKTILATITAALLCYGAANAELITSYARSGQTVTLDLGWTGHNYGDIQWQTSTDGGKTWNDVKGATMSTYAFKASNDAYYRAVVKGDPSCPDVIVERHIVPVIFNTNIVEEQSDNVTMEVTDLNFADAVITEVGMAYGLTDLSRDYTLLPRTKADVGDVNGIEQFEMTCGGLVPDTKYNVRAYFKTADGSLIFGPGKLANTTPGICWSTEDWTIEKNQLIARMLAKGVTPTNMKFYIGKDADNMTSYPVNFISDGVYSSSRVRNLEAGAEYLIKFVAEVDGDEVEISRTVRTMSDYSNIEVDETVKPVSHVVEWDNTNLVCFSPEGMQVEYPRICRVDDQKLLLTYHGGPTDHWKNSYLRKSYDNGKTWTNPVITFDASRNFYGSGFYRICNPEMTRLQNGWILMSVVANANPETNENCKVLLSISKDDGDTWSDPIIVGRGRTWEPQVIQMPNGELELLVSSEAAWWGKTNNMPQEILSARSTDNGETWTAFQRACFLPGCRDGMPVSVVMQGNKGVLFVIESVGSGLPPSLVHRTLDGKWDVSDWNRQETNRRWLADLNGGAGAPYMIQLPTGEFLIMAHTDQTGAVWQTCRPQVVMADNTGHNFKYKRIPLNKNVVPAGTGCYYNSFFLYDNDTVWLLFTQAKYNGDKRENSAIMMMQGKIVER